MARPSSLFFADISQFAADLAARNDLDIPYSFGIQLRWRSRTPVRILKTR